MGYMMLNISLDWCMRGAIFSDIAIEILILKGWKSSILNGEITMSILSCRNSQIICEERARGRTPSIGV
jgi:hypothetical protein